MQKQEIEKTIGIAVLGLVMGWGALAIFKGKSPEEIAACNAQLECIGRQEEIYAEVYCKSEIEKLVLHDVRWPDGTMFGRIFERYRWKDREKGIVTYVGHAAKFQNGFGAWSPASYECDVDVKAEHVVEVRAW